MSNSPSATFRRTSDVQTLSSRRCNTDDRRVRGTDGGARVAGFVPAVGTSGHASHVAQSEEDTSPRADVSLDTRRQQLIGVRTVRVARAVMAPHIRAAGTVTYDETRQVEVNTRIDGWVRELYADYTGRLVQRGEPLFTLYSPDLIAEQNDYLLACAGARNLVRRIRQACRTIPTGSPLRRANDCCVSR
jgi:hypothetical protein